MTSERFLVTGALGCVGAWAVKRLVDEGLPVWTYDLGTDPHRLRLIMTDEAIEQKVTMVNGDIADLAHLERVVVENGITRIVHLAALQVPFVRADPVLGARVNVAGTAVVLEVMRRQASQVEGLALASSIAVYGPPQAYSPGPLENDAPHLPDTLYGAYKHVNEEMARVYWQDYGVKSIALRPYIVYGPGRDQGLTSAPTKAILATAAGQGYTIGFNGTYVYQYADDVARAFIVAARASLPGANAFSLGGACVSIEEVIGAIEAAVPEARGQITSKSHQLPFPPQIDGTAFDRAVGSFEGTPLTDAVEQTIAQFRSVLKAGRIDLARALQ